MLVVPPRASEMRRVADAAQALEDGDAVRLGALMAQGHQSLSEDFESTTPEIDARVAERIDEPDVLGARLQGAGWGGRLAVLRRSD